MDIHENARTTQHSRMLMVHRLAAVEAAKLTSKVASFFARKRS